jgi:hypothetical protein
MADSVSCAKKEQKVAQGCSMILIADSSAVSDQQSSLIPKIIYCFILLFIDY